MNVVLFILAVVLGGIGLAQLIHLFCSYGVEGTGDD
jgi:hypothetical protein